MRLWMSPEAGVRGFYGVAGGPVRTDLPIMGYGKKGMPGLEGCHETGIGAEL